ncbi:Sister chromatid cohesion protein PDS5 like A [Spatholobus suberectus]|nr:Sister chromatid cohesion protein PDS5 like A [Spatholobus suberectus]
MDEPSLQHRSDIADDTRAESEKECLVDNIKDVIELIINLFEDLGDYVTPNFLKRATKVLDTITESKCYVIMLHIDNVNRIIYLVLRMFKNFFSVVRLRSTFSLPPCS